MSVLIALRRRSRSKDVLAMKELCHYSSLLLLWMDLKQLSMFYLVTQMFLPDFWYDIRCLQPYE